MNHEHDERWRRGVSRREALSLLLGTGIVAAAGRLGAQPRSDGLIQRAIPRTGEQVPAVGLGSSDTFEVGAAAAERAPVRAVLQRYVGLGGRVVDTSPMYGTAETVIGDLAWDLGIQSDLWLATKVWTSGREAGIAQMERSFRRLRTDRVDLIQVHNLIDTQTHLRTLRAWREQGRVRYLGVTHYRVDAYDALDRVLREEALDFVQFNYSIATREAERRLLPLAAERGTAVLINRAFEDGRLFRAVRAKPLPVWASDMDCSSWAQFFLKYVVSHPAVTCVIPATSKVKHLVDNMGAGRGRLPDTATRKRMVEYFESL